MPSLEPPTESKPHPLSTPPTATLTLTVVTLATLSISLVRSHRRLSRTLRQRHTLAAALRRQANSDALDAQTRATLAAVEYETAAPPIYGGPIGPRGAATSTTSSQATSWDWTPSAPPKGPPSLAASHWSRMSREELRKGWVATTGARQSVNDQEELTKAGSEVRPVIAPLADCFQLRLDIADELFNELGLGLESAASSGGGGGSSSGSVSSPKRGKLTAPAAKIPSSDVPAIPTASAVFRQSADLIPLEPPKPRATSTSRPAVIPPVPTIATSDAGISYRLRHLLARPDRVGSPPPPLIKRAKDDSEVRLVTRTETIRADKAPPSSPRSHMWTQSTSQPAWGWDRAAESHGSSPSCSTLDFHWSRAQATRGGAVTASRWEWQRLSVFVAARNVRPRRGELE